MNEQGSLPRARKEGLLEDTVGEELLLYDQNSHTAHCLSPVAACVWRHCDGERNVSELAELAGVSKSLAADALHELREKDLLDAELSPSTVPGVSRREAIVRVARVGAGAAGASLIVSATAATPAMASSGELEPCKKAINEGEGNCCYCQNGTCSSSQKTKEPECATFCGGADKIHTWLPTKWVCK